MLAEFVVDLLGAHNRGDAHDKVVIESSQREIVMEGKDIAHGKTDLKLNGNQLKIFY